METLTPPVAGPDATVVVVAAGPWSETVRCLMALPQACRGVAHEVVVVDDGTTDETAEVLPRLEGVTTVRGETPQGFAAAANAGASLARAPHALLLRSGAEPGPGLLAALLGAAAGQPGAAAVLAPPAGLLVSLPPFAAAGGFDPAAEGPEADLRGRLEAVGATVLDLGATGQAVSAPSPPLPAAPSRGDFTLFVAGPAFPSGPARLHLHAEMASHLRRLRPTTVLEIGPGRGALGLALRESLDLAEGRAAPEAWSFRLDGLTLDATVPLAAAVYDRLIDGPLEAALPGLERYDVILLVDVLDRLRKADGLRLMAALLERTRHHLIVTASAAGATTGEAEAGVASAWSDEDFAPLRARVELMRVPAARGAWLVTLAPPGEPTAPVPAALRPRLARVDAVWDGPPPAPRRLRLAYLLPHQHLTGGMKVLVDQVQRLRARGHFVRAVLEGTGARAMPAWCGHAADEEVVVPRGGPVSAALRNVDAVVCGWFQASLPCLKAGPPVLYLEQGHEHLFEYPQWHLSEWYQVVRTFDAAMASPLALATVSPHVTDLLLQLFGRRAALVPNGVDVTAFTPERTPRRANRLLLIGNPTLAFKGFETATRAIARVVHQVKDLEVTWVSQQPAPVGVLPCKATNLVDPPQAELPAIFRRHDLHVFTSRYESFALPPLEAMASGVPVAATDCGGIRAYAVDGDNCLLVRPGDHQALGDAMLRILGDGALRERFARRGRETAEAFSVERSIDRLEEALGRVAARGPIG